MVILRARPGKDGRKPPSWWRTPLLRQSGLLVGGEPYLILSHHDREQWHIPHDCHNSWSRVTCHTYHTHTFSSMKAAVLGVSLLLAAQSALAFPTDQVILSTDRFPKLPEYHNYVDEFLSDAKKAILKGKKDLEKWIHRGRQFIKENGLLCEYYVACSCTLSTHSFVW